MSIFDSTDAEPLQDKLYSRDELDPRTDWVEEDGGGHRDPNPCWYGLPILREFRRDNERGGYVLTRSVPTEANDVLGEHDD